MDSKPGDIHPDTLYTAREILEAIRASINKEDVVKNIEVFTSEIGVDENGLPRLEMEFELGHEAIAYTVTVKGEFMS